MGFMEGDKYLPGHVDEGKLLLFIKDEVAGRPPRKGLRLKAERKRKAEEVLQPSSLKKVMIERKGEPLSLLLVEGEDDDTCSGAYV